MDPQKAVKKSVATIKNEKSTSQASTSSSTNNPTTTTGIPTMVTTSSSPASKINTAVKPMPSKKPSPTPETSASVAGKSTGNLSSKTVAKAPPVTATAAVKPGQTTQNISSSTLKKPPKVPSVDLLNTGNDQVTVDQPHAPLVPTPKSSQSSSSSAVKRVAPSGSQVPTGSDVPPLKSTLPSSSSAPVPAVKRTVPSMKKATVPVKIPIPKAPPSGQIPPPKPKPTPKPASPAVIHPVKRAAVKFPTPSSAAAFASTDVSKLINTSISSDTAAIYRPPNAPGSATATATAMSSQASSRASSRSPSPDPVSGSALPTTSTAILDEQAVWEAQRQKERAPLTDTYGDFIVGPDMCLEDAQTRLRTALEQTRQLRRAFTDRVYSKYRVCLTPPASTEQILTRILLDPSGSVAQLEEEMVLVQAEKEWEKKEAQKLNTEIVAATAGVAAATTPSGNSAALPDTAKSSEANLLAAVNAENADQLMYVSAGLALIVLPEHDSSGIDMSRYRDRAPIHQGQRVKSISAAAASAGDVMLDRARKGAALRAERLRLQQELLGTGTVATSTPEGDTATDAVLGYSRLEFLNNAVATGLISPAMLAGQTPGLTKGISSSIATSDLGGIVPPVTMKAIISTKLAVAVSNLKAALFRPSSFAATARSTASAAASGNKRPQPKASSSRSSSPTPAPSKVKPSAASALPSATAKALKARVQTTMSVQTLLSLNPAAEELRTDGKVSAATMALMERGVGTTSNGSSKSQHSNSQRLRHPFPDSLGGRRRAIQERGGSAVKHATATAASNSAALLHPVYLPLALPPLPTTKERRTRKRLRQIVTDPSRMGSYRAKKSIDKVIQQFLVPAASRKRRRVTEITFLHGLQNFSGSKGSSGTGDSETSSDMTVNAGNSGSSSPLVVDPMLAFHVMQAVGLVQATSIIGEEDDLSTSTTRPIFPANLNTAMFQLAEKRAMGDDGGISRRSIGRLKSLHAKFISKESRVFTELVLDRPPVLVKEAKPKDTTFVESFHSTSAGLSESTSEKLEDAESETSAPVQAAQDTRAKPPVLPLRGGGEAIKSDKNESGSNTSKVFGKEGQNQSNGSNTTSPKADSDSSVNSRLAKMSDQSSPPRQGQGNLPTSAPQTPVWNDPSRQSLVLMNSGMNTGQHNVLMQQSDSAAAMARGGRMPSQMPGVEHYHPNAIQLANQLRFSRMPAQGPQGGSQFTDYIGSLHPQSPAGYDWSAIGAASAAAVASAQSLAALGLSPHRNVMSNFPIQDRARAMIREQQTAASAAAHVAAAHRQQQAMAFMAGGHGYQQGAAPHFAHMGGAMLNPSAAFMGQQAMTPVPLQTQQRSVSTKQGPSIVASNAEKNDASQNLKEESATDSTKKDFMAASQVDKKPTNESNGSSETSSADKKRKLPEGTTDFRPEKHARTEDKAIKGAIEKGNSNTLETEGKPQNPSGLPGPTGTLGSSITAATKSPTITSKVDTSKVVKMQEVNPAKEIRNASQSDRLKFFVPPAPIELSTDVASLILAGRGNEAVDKASKSPSVNKAPLVGYMVALGAAVPIPKTLVANSFKDKMNALTSKSVGVSSVPQASREVAVASILLWLWRNHEPCFQRAFAKSGRIDVDPECKWLIAAAVDKAVKALSKAIDIAASRTSSPLAVALAISKKGISTQKGPQEKDSERPATVSKLDLLVMSIVSKALMAGLKIDLQIDAALPNFNGLVDYLDESRKSVLHSKSQERALLAALISRKATMSLPFSHAYVSSMVRAGEALGHGELFEVVQNEDVNVSTMIPYDVFTDESGAWEDPCRSLHGFNTNLTGDDLMRRAHARAMIQKSLKKLQDRHNIKGGTPAPGAYTDPPTAGSGNASDTSKSPSQTGATTPRGWLKRRSSFSEPPTQPGTGSAVATSWSLYEPKHIAAPLAWNSEHVENNPYGRHDSETRPRSLSLSQFNLKLPGGRGRGRQTPRAMSVASVDQLKEPEPDNGTVRRSTREIPWVDVADIFHNVNLPGTPKNAPEVPATPRGRTIFAPFVRQVEFDKLGGSIDDESDDEEDLRDQMVLHRHQVVLDHMKEHLSSFLEARKKNQDRKKSKTSKT